MINHMKTTLIIPDELIRQLKRLAAETGRTLSAVVSEALRKGLRTPARNTDVPRLPAYRMGRPKVDLADRDSLSRAMEDE